MNDEERRTPVARPTPGEMLTARKQILSLSPKDALDAIIDSPHASELVRSFPEEDLQLLIHEIGVEDALPLLALASDDQWTYLLDIETWEQDHFEVASYTRWLNYLANADPDRLVGRFFDEHLDGMELYFFRNIEVVVREHDEDATAFGEDFITLDDQFYVRFLDDPATSESDPIAEEDRKDFLLRFLQRLAAYDHFRYQKVLLEASRVIPAETEEEMYRLRNVRLAEKGFLPFDEAIGIYQPLQPGDVERLGVKAGIGSARRDLPASIQLPAVRDEGGNLFTDALNLIDSEEDMLQIQAEVAGLSNQIVSADKLKITDRGQLDDVVQKAIGYAAIGLETLTIDGEGRNLSRAAALLQKYPLSHFFRIGYGLALELKWRTKEWQDRSWPAAHGFPLSFWGEHWLGVLGGLLIDRPLFYGNYETGTLYREFSRLEDIRVTEEALNSIIAADRLLTLMSIRLPSAIPKGTISYKSLMLTLWARHHLGLPVLLSPMALHEFRRLYDDLWLGGDPGRKVKPSMKSSFLDWLSETTGLKHGEIAQELGGVFDSLFREIESEYGQVPAAHLNAKYIQLFLLES